MTEGNNAEHSLANNLPDRGEGMTPEDVVPLLEDWERSQIEDLVEVLRAMLDEDPDPEGGNPEESSPSGNGGGTAKAKGGWVELRTINGCGPYAYQRWWDGKRKRSKYIGKVQKEAAA